MTIKLKNIGKRTLASTLCILMMFSTLLVGSISTASALSCTGGYVYFDTTGWNTSTYSTVQICIGHSNYTSAYNMTKVANTNLYYYSMSNWDGATYIAFIANSGSWSSGNWSTSNLSNASCYTGTLNYSLYSGNTYLFTKASASNGAALNGTYYSGGYGDLNNSQIIKMTTSTDGNTYSVPSTSPATINLLGYAFDGNGSCVTSKNSSIAAGSSTVTTSASMGYTANTTVKVSDIYSDYEFVGLYNGDTKISDLTSYTYNPTSTNTIEARFKLNSSLEQLEIPIITGNGVTSGLSVKQGTPLSIAVSNEYPTDTTLTFTLDGKSCDLTGIGGTIDTKDLAVGEHKLVVTASNKDYASSSATFTFEVTEVVLSIKIDDYTISNTWVAPNESTYVTVVMKKAHGSSGNSVTYKAQAYLLDANGKTVFTSALSDEWAEDGAGKKVTFAPVDVTYGVEGTYDVAVAIFGYDSDGEVVDYGYDNDAARTLTISDSPAMVTLTARLTVTSDSGVSIAEGASGNLLQGETVILNGYCNNGNKSAGEYGENTVTKYVYNYYYYTTDSNYPTLINTVTDDNVDLNGKPVTQTTVEFTIPKNAKAGTEYNFYVEIIAMLDDEAISEPCSSLERGVITGIVVGNYKESAYSDSAWVDANPSYNGGSTATLIKWTKYIKGDGTVDRNNNSSVYTFYLPATVDMDNVIIYHAFNSLKIGDTVIASGEGNKFTTNTLYKLVVSADNWTSSSTRYVRFMQGSSDSAQMYLNTTNSDGTNYDLPLTINSKVYNDASASEYKEEVQCTSGDVISVDTEGEITTNTIKKIKGRGNSSWEASCRLFGKYSYNITLNTKQNLFGLAGDGNVNKKYCILANNVDGTESRNAYVFQLAKNLGFEYYPNYQTIDFYDNGNYMGSYLVTQKVELGTDCLVNIKGVSNSGDAEETSTKETYTGEYSNGNSIRYDAGVTAPENYEKGNYLLEFELNERYRSEISSFVSNKGQPIVVSDPESASKSEVEFLCDQWNRVENAVYNGNLDSVRDYIDVESFAKMYLIQELTKNLDGGATSYYLIYKGDEGKFYAEPVWDFDWALGQYSGTKTIIYPDGTVHNTNVGTPDGFFAKYKAIYGSTTTRDFQSALCVYNQTFWAEVQTIWKNEFYNTASDDLTNFLANYFEDIKDTVDMNEYRWRFIANNPSASWGTTNTGKTLSAQDDYLINWISTRLTWLNNNIADTTYYYVTVEASEGGSVSRSYPDYIDGFASGTLCTFAAKGNNFIGWYSDSTYTNEVSKSAFYSQIITADTTLYALFDANIDTKDVTYYIDMHDNVVNSASINFTNNIDATLRKVADSTVYSATVSIPYYANAEGNPIALGTFIESISVDNNTYTLNSQPDTKCIVTGEVWLEANRNLSDVIDSIVVGKTEVDDTATTKRIYLTYNGWSNIRIYCYNSKTGSKNADWPGEVMKKAPNQNNYNQDIYYYDVDVKYDKIIFANAISTTSSNMQTIDIDISNATATSNNQYWIKDTTENGKYEVGCTSVISPTITSYYSEINMLLSETDVYVTPIASTGAEINYYSYPTDVLDVNSNGLLSPKTPGEATVHIKTTGTFGDTYQIETKVNIGEKAAASLSSFSLMSYQSSTSIFSAVNGTIDVTAIIEGSAYANDLAGGIITESNGTYTVKYAVADTDVQGYDNFKLIITATATAEDGYIFEKWTKNGDAIKEANENSSTDVLFVDLTDSVKNVYIAYFVVNH